MSESDVDNPQPSTSNAFVPRSASETAPAQLGDRPSGTSCTPSGTLLYTFYPGIPVGIRGYYPGRIEDSSPPRCQRSCSRSTGGLAWPVTLEAPDFEDCTIGALGL